MELTDRYQKLPQSLRDDLEDFLGRYQQAGYQCLLVGGSIRDLLMGGVPVDFDFATNCPLEVTEELFRKVLQTGPLQGTLTVMHRGHSFEVTRYRKDVKTDGRKAVVTFAETIEEDQIRRDLRINSIAFDPLTGEVFDSQGGMQDFNEKKIRFVGKASQRVLEDHLRALRYLRMISRLKPLGFEYDVDEMQEVLKSFDSERLSLERVYDEFIKIFKLEKSSQSFLVDHLLLLHPLKRLVANPTMAREMYFTALEMKDLLPFAFFAMKSGQQEERELKLPKKKLSLARLLLEFESEDLNDPVQAKRLLSRAGSMDSQNLVLAVEGLLHQPFAEKYENYKKDPLFIKDLKISPKDLMELGFYKKDLGEAQKRLLAYLWLHPEDNHRESLLKLAKTFAKKDESSGQ